MGDVGVRETLILEHDLLVGADSLFVVRLGLGLGVNLPRFRGAFQEHLVIVERSDVFFLGTLEVKLTQRN